jgi:hypothetical protein
LEFLYFSHDYTKVWGRKTTEINYHSHHLTPRIQIVMWFISSNLDQLAGNSETMLGFLTVQFLFSLSIFIGENSLCIAHTEGVVNYTPLLWAESSYINNLKFLWMGDLYFLYH